GGPLPDHIERLIHALGVAPQHADHELFRLEVRIGADGHVREGALELPHQRVETRLHREREMELAHGGGGSGGEKLRLELFGEDAFHLQRYARQKDDLLAIRLVYGATSDAASIAEDVRRVGGDARDAEIAFGPFRRLEES